MRVRRGKLSLVSPRDRVKAHLTGGGALKMVRDADRKEARARGLGQAGPFAMMEQAQQELREGALFQSGHLTEVMEQEANRAERKGKAAGQKAGLLTGLLIAGAGAGLYLLIR